MHFGGTNPSEVCCEMSVKELRRKVQLSSKGKCESRGLDNTLKCASIFLVAAWYSTNSCRLSVMTALSSLSFSHHASISSRYTQHTLSLPSWPTILKKPERRLLERPSQRVSWTRPLSTSCRPLATQQRGQERPAPLAESPLVR